MRSELTREIRETREAETTVIPLSFSQLRFWFQRELDRGGESPHASMALRLTGRPDAVALREALRDVVTRHESLRTVFPVTDGVPGQRILETVTVELPVRRIEEPDVEAAVADAAGHRFDLEREIPLRAVLLAVGPEDDHVLAITVHHMGFDGWSVAPFLRDLSHAYTARVDGRPPDWDELPFQYVDFTLWQRKELGAPDDPGSLFAEQLTHWTRALADAPAELPLPTDRPRPATATHRAGTVPFHLPPDGFRDLNPARPPARGQHVHGPPRRARGVPPAARRGHGHPGRQPRRRPHRRRPRRPRRLLRQHRRRPDRHLRRPRLP